MSVLADLGVRTVRADLTVDPDMVSLVGQVVDETGRVDVLVNNAGYGAYGSLEEVPLDEARRQFEVNVFALARLTQLVLPHMRARRSGCIVNVSSMGGRFGEPMGDWYHATKFAVEGLSDSLRPELAPFGIHVVVIQPGTISSEWGAIAAQHLIEASGDGPYADQAARSAAVLAMTRDGVPHGSPPEVIADAVLKAATSSRPRTRYRVGRLAKPFVVARKLLPDRAWDRALSALYTAGARRT
jgi:NAD(P)-dependent dehydrogenase (short-subunit alcohol dehydrogenase family)